MDKGLAQGIGLLAASSFDDQVVRRDIEHKIDGVVNDASVLSDLIGAEHAAVLRAALQSLNESPEINIIDVMRRVAAEVKNLQETIAQLTHSDQVPLQARINELEIQIRDLEEVLEAKNLELRAALKRAQSAEHAAGDIIRIREELLDEAQKFSQRIEEAVESVRTTKSQSGEVMAAYLEFSQIQEIYNDALELFKALSGELLGSVQLYRDVLGELEALGSQMTSAKQIPSIQLFGSAVACHARLQALKGIQDQLIVDQMSTPEFPEEWIEGGMLKDFYGTLDLQKEATEENIRESFKKLSRETHPDLNPDNPEAEEKFRSVREAYGVLSDPETRSLYDSLF